MITTYRDTDRARGRAAMTAVIEAVSTGVSGGASSRHTALQMLAPHQFETLHTAAVTAA